MGFEVPIRRLRYNPNPDQAMKGDDVLGFRFSSTNQANEVLVGESKYRSDKTPSKVRGAVENAYSSVCSPNKIVPVSLNFVATILELEKDLKRAQSVRQIRAQLESGQIAVERHYLIFLGTLGRPEDPFRCLDQQSAAESNVTCVNVVFADGIQDWLNQLFDGGGMIQMDQRELEIKKLHNGIWLKLSGADPSNWINQNLLAAATWFERNLSNNSATATEDRFLSAFGYYLAGHYAQAYVLFQHATASSEPKPVFRLLQKLFAKELTGARLDCNNLLSCLEYSDTRIANDLESGAIKEEDAVERAIVAVLHNAFLGVTDYVLTGDSAKIDQAVSLIDSCYLILRWSRFDGHGILLAESSNLYEKNICKICCQQDHQNGV